MQNDDFAAAALPYTIVHSAPTTSNTAADTQVQANAHALHVEENAAKAGASPLIPTFGANDAPVAVAAASVAASAPNVEPNNSAPAGGSASHSSTANDASLPTPVVVRQSAEAIELSPALQAWNGGDNPQTRLVQSAHLGGNLRESEMSIALQADTLGTVELRARVTGDVVGAAIGVERHDAHAMISGDLLALHQALHDRQLRVGDVSVFQGTLHSGSAAGDGRPPQHRETAQQRPPASGWATERSSTLPEIAAFNEGHDAGTSFDSNGRLSVRA
jgi:hypothetical protein